MATGDLGRCGLWLKIGIVVPQVFEIRRLVRLLPAILVGLVVLVFWSVVLDQTEHSVFGRVPVLDEVFYLDRAAEIASGTLIPAEPFFMSPLYPYLVAATGAGGGVPESRVFSGGTLRGLRLFQIACWLGTLLLVHLMAGRMVPDHWRGGRRRWAVWLPVGLLALYRPAAVYTMAVMLETPLVFLVTLAVFLMGELWRRPVTWRVTVVLGLVLAWAGLLRGTALLLVPLAVGVVAFRGGRKRDLLLMVCAMVAVLSVPVMINSYRSAKICGASLNGGINLYIGNGPEANGFYVAAVPGDWREDPGGRAFLTERLARSTVSLAEADSIWAGEAWRAMRADPGRVARLMLRKMWLQVQGWEIDQLAPLAGWRRAVPALGPLVAPYAVLVVFGIVGLLGLAGRRGSLVLVAALVLLILGQSLFFVVSRYRLVLVPLWAAPAGMGAVWLAAGRRRLWLAAVLAAVMTVPWGLNEVRESWGALAQANEALRWLDIGRERGEAPALKNAALVEAVVLYRHSLAVESTRVASWLGLATALGAQGNIAAQVQVLQDGIDAVGDPYPLQRAGLAVALAQDDPAHAIALVTAILGAHPRDANALHNGAILWARAGKGAQALAAARRLRVAVPADPRGYIDTGVLLARAGHAAAAREAFQTGLEHCPGNAELLHNLGLVASSLGKP